MRREVGRTDPEALITTIGGGMRRPLTGQPAPSNSSCIAPTGASAATAIDVAFSCRVRAHTTELAARVAVARDEGRTVLSALSGRRPPPDNFSVVSSDPPVGQAR